MNKIYGEKKENWMLVSNKDLDKFLADGWTLEVPKDKVKEKVIEKIEKIEEPKKASKKDKKEDKKEYKKEDKR